MPWIGGLLERMENAIDGVMAGLLAITPLDKDSESNARKKTEKLDDDSTLVHGIVVPQLVAQQLLALGKPLNWYSSSELAAAVQACAHDCTLIDDHHGINFLDSLTLTDEEKENRPGHRLAKTDNFEDYIKTLIQSRKPDAHDANFCERITCEREEKKKSLAAGEEIPGHFATNSN